MLFYYKDQSDKQIPRLSSADFVLNLTHQDGRLIWGSLTSSDVTQPWIGTFWNDGKSLQGVDSNGQVEGRMLDANNMEVVYTPVGSPLITSHIVFSRN